MGTHGADGASGATGYQRGSKDLFEVVGFVLGKGEREGKGGDETRIATERHHKGKGRTLVLLQLRHTQVAQPPQTHILPGTA